MTLKRSGVRPDAAEFDLGDGITVRPTEYEVSLLPGDNINHSVYAVSVQYRGRGLWAVYRMKQCLARDGVWDYESIPSERTDEWLAEHRFPFDEALELARREAPNVYVNGLTAAEAYRRFV